MNHIFMDNVAIAISNLPRQNHALMHEFKMKNAAACRSDLRSATTAIMLLSSDLLCKNID